ncbi:uracil-xanthine permease family protein [Aquibaculum arenosum]|uniref:Solute carrier family 23 protein n=1 Tax=Aquibaculum arenosum TaxID=3032591 RepID=A0ABT5YJG9_9PROT|nr:solute carrier family 23 protein [Fodinicurvata sp. CAU 1616]MDF2095062.1 solute carrier family 23 protein [Fodinicurvata sp. CAU 1616]
MLALQHAALVAIFLIVAVTVARMAGLDAESGRNFLALTMVAGGLGAILQALAWRGMGSGYLVPPTTTTIFLPAAGSALAAGGLPLLFGMMVYSGLVTAVLSRFIHRLRPIFPAEIAGFVVLMVGLSVVVLAMRNFLGVGLPHGDASSSVLIAGFALTCMVALNVWGSAQLRLYSSLLGVGIGCIAALVAGGFGHRELAAVGEAPWIALPRPFTMGLAFDAALLVPFTIAALAIALNALGAITAAQKVEDADWKRPEMGSLGRGIMADGTTNVVAGLLGGFGQASTSGAVGLSEATGANSRVIAFVLGGLLILVAFLPKIGAFLLAMPAPVVGAALTFSGCFLITSAIQMIASRMLDARKTFVLGIAFSLGVAAFVFPEHFEGAPDWLQPWVGSPLSISVATAVLLNLIFRFGVFQRNAITLDSHSIDQRQLAEFIASQGALWGAPQDLVYRTEFMTIEAIDALVDHGLVQDAVKVSRQQPPVSIPGGLIGLSTRFDEFSLQVTITYRGVLLEPSDKRPSSEEVLEEDGQLRLARYMVGRAADRAKAERQGDLCVLTLTLQN